MKPQHPDMLSRLPAFLLLISFSLLVGACATWYQKNSKFNQAFESGSIQQANQLLQNKDKEAEGKDRLLYFLDRGVVLQMLGEYEESNAYFEKAYLYLQDFRKSYGFAVLSMISNPMVRPYPGEDHEKVLIHYYKALNYLMLNDPQSALVEARRINNQLNEFNTKYEDHPNRYKTDAWAHTIMGIAYDIEKDVNNAFIAYRNAYYAYRNIYEDHFGTQIPEQLKYDLLRTAAANGFWDELRKFETEFGINRESYAQPNPELIFFWHNGLGPVKEEWSINFTLVKGDGGVILFENTELGLSFPFPIYDSDIYDEDEFSDLRMVRVAFPKYALERAHYQGAALVFDSTDAYPLEISENGYQIARSVLQDRLLREMSTALLRLAAKQASEAAIREQNEDLGTVISIINAATEKADTRNWQTLPHSISYARIPLDTGEYHYQLKSGDAVHGSFNVDLSPGETEIQLFHSL